MTCLREWRGFKFGFIEENEKNDQRGFLETSSRCSGQICLRQILRSPSGLPKNH